MSDAEDKVILLPPRPVRSDVDHAVADAVQEGGWVPDAPEPSEPAPEMQPRWPAIWTFLAISIAALAAAALVPSGPEGTIKWPTAIAFMFAILMGGGALLYRFAREYWIAKP